jgi:hypothetical protein
MRARASHRGKVGIHFLCPDVAHLLLCVGTNQVSMKYGGVY